MRFMECVRQRGLVDLGFTWPCFMWNHGRGVGNRRWARLDKGICNDVWSPRFPEAIGKHLPHTYSDRCPLLLQIKIQVNNSLGSIPFRIQQRDFLGRLEAKGKSSRGFERVYSKGAGVEQGGFWQHHI